MSSSKNGFSMSDFHQKTEELETLQKDVTRFEGKVDRLERQLSEARDELSTTRRRVTSLSSEVDGLIRRAMAEIQKGPNAAFNRSQLIGVIGAALRGANGGQQSFDVDPPAGAAKTGGAKAEGAPQRRDPAKASGEPEGNSDEAGEAGEAGDAGTPSAAAA